MVKSSVVLGVCIAFISQIATALPASHRIPAHAKDVSDALVNATNTSIPSFVPPSSVTPSSVTPSSVTPSSATPTAVSRSTTGPEASDTYRVPLVKAAALAADDDADYGYDTVRVYGDAMYLVRVPVCGRGGSHCPPVGARAISDCQPSHASYLGPNAGCLAARTSTCQPNPADSVYQRFICVYDAPVTEPVVVATTSAAPTTAAPNTTAAPTTQEVTTAGPTTADSSALLQADAPPRENGQAAGSGALVTSLALLAAAVCAAGVAAAVRAAKKTRVDQASVLAMPAEDDDHEGEEQEEKAAADDDIDVVHC